MKFGKLYLLLVLFVLSSWNSVFAQSVTFSDIRLEHNVPDNSGRKMLQFHYSMTVMGCQGHDVRVYMWVDIPQGVTHYYANGNKMISQSNNLHCSWETTNFQNGWIGIYNDQLNPRPGKNTYYTRLGAWDETLKRYIGWSDFLSFTNTGSGSDNHQELCYWCKGKRSCTICYGVGYFTPTLLCTSCHGTKMCAHCYGTGYEPIINQPIINNQPVPPTYTREKIECVDCKGSGKCTWCAGRGEYRNQYSGIMDDCRKCNGGGVCPTCHGRKYQ